MPHPVVATRHAAASTAGRQGAAGGVIATRIVQLKAIPARRLMTQCACGGHARLPLKLPSRKADHRSWTSI
jgi:hypothetical protein